MIDRRGMITRQRCQVSVQAGLAPRFEASEATMSCCMVMPVPRYAEDETAERRVVSRSWLKADQGEADEHDAAYHNGIKQNPQRIFWHCEPRHHVIIATSDISYLGGTLTRFCCRCNDTRVLSLTSMRPVIS